MVKYNLQLRQACASIINCLYTRNVSFRSKMDRPVAKKRRFAEARGMSRVLARATVFPLSMLSATPRHPGLGQLIQRCVEVQKIFSRLPGKTTGKSFTRCYNSVVYIVVVRIRNQTIYRSCRRVIVIKVLIRCWVFNSPSI